MTGNKFSGQRNYGIDLLRIVSMFMVVILHVLGQGGVLQQTESGGKFAVVWFMEIGAYCAVDCYALISGFVGFSEEEKDISISRYIQLWMQVVFYSVVIMLLFKVLYPNLLSKRQTISAFFPISFGQYWYFSAYTGVFLFMPWINKMVRSVKQKELSSFIILCLVIFSFYSTVIQSEGDPFGLMGGYSFLWFVFLYIIGAFIKKYQIYKCMKKKYLGLEILGLIFFTWGWKLCVGELSERVLGNEIGAEMFISYISPTILGIAIMLLLLFVQLNVVGFAKKCVQFIAPATFGVYLIHTHPLVFEYCIKGRFSKIVNWQVWTIPIAILIVSAVIFAGCILIDKLRACMFNVLKVKRLAVKVEIVGRKIEASVLMKLKWFVGG